MTIQPSVSQSVSKYADVNRIGSSNLFVGIDATTQNVYRTFINLPVGVDVVEDGFTITWDTVLQTITIESPDTAVDLQESFVKFYPYTLDPNDNTIVEIGLDATQPTDKFIAVYHYTIIGVPSSWSAMNYVILWAEGVGGGGGVPLPVGSLGNDVNAALNYSYSFTATGTGNATNASCSASITSNAITGSGLADILANVQTQIGSPSVSTSVSSGSVFQTCTATISAMSIVIFSGVDAIFDGDNYYKTTHNNFNNGLTNPAFSGYSASTIGMSAFNLSFGRSTLPNDVALFPNENQFDIAKNSGGLSYGRWGSSSDGSGGFAPNTLGQSLIERYVMNGNPSVPTCSWNILRWRCTYDPSNTGNWLGISQAEVDLLPDVYYNRFGSTGKTIATSQGYSASYDSSQLGCMNLRTSYPGTFNYINISQCEVYATNNGTSWNVLNGISINTTAAGTYDISIDPALITDINSVKKTSLMTSIVPTGVTPMLNLIETSSTAGIVYMSNGLIPYILTNAVLGTLLMFQQYDANGKLLPY